MASRPGRRTLAIVCAVLLGVMAASSIYESRTPPELVLSRRLMSAIPAEEYEMQWVDDRPFEGERTLVDPCADTTGRTCRCSIPAALSQC